MMITEKSLMITSMFVCSSMLDADGDDCNDAFELEADIGQVGFSQCIMLLLKVVALVIEV